MTRIQVNRALDDWITRPVSRSEVDDESQLEAAQQGRQLIGVVGRVGNWIQLELDVQLAQRLLAQIEEAMADPKLPDAKLGAFTHGRRQLLIAFPDLERRSGFAPDR